MNKTSINQQETVCECQHREIIYNIKTVDLKLGKLPNYYLIYYILIRYNIKTITWIDKHFLTKPGLHNRNVTVKNNKYYDNN